MTKITIREVAKEAGVSIATVSKALNGVKVVNEVTRERVIQAAEKLHYVPNLMGKQLKSGKTQMLGFYTSSIAGPYFSMLLDAIAKESEKWGYGVNVFISSNKQVVLNSIMGNVVDGIIGFEDLITEDDLEAMKREKIKAVFIDRKFSSDTIGSVTFDSRKAGKDATDYLISMGHRRIAYITGISGVYDSDGRFQGHQESLREAGIEFEDQLLLTGLFEEEASYQVVKKFLKESHSLPTAFLAGNDLSAIGTVKALQESGFRVPEDFSVMGFDDIDLLEYFLPKLTTVHNPIAEQGQHAVRQLIGLVEVKKVSGKAEELRGSLVIRESTRQLA